MCLRYILSKGFGLTCAANAVKMGRKEKAPVRRPVKFIVTKAVCGSRPRSGELRMYVTNIHNGACTGHNVSITKKQTVIDWKINAL